MINDIISLEEVKNWLNKKDGDEDQRLSWIASAVSSFVENYCNKLFLTRQLTEFHDGENKRFILTRRYPIYKVSSLYDDPDCEYGSDDLIASTNYVVDWDSGKVTLINDYWTFYRASQNVKIVYSAGYSRYNLIDEQNNYFDVTDSGGTVAIELTPPATPSDTKYPGYDLADFISALQTALNAEATLAGAYTVLYDYEVKKFKISCTETFSLLFGNGTNATKSIAGLLGFHTTSDKTGLAEYVSDYPVDGLPPDIKMAAQMIVHKLYKDAQGALVETRTALPQGAGTTEWIKGLPIEARMILDNYTRAYL